MADPALATQGVPHGSSLLEDGGQTELQDQVTGWSAQWEELRQVLRDPRSFHPRENPLALVGLLWAVPVPVFFLALDLHARGLPWSLEGVTACLAGSWVHLVALAHVPAFMVVFGAFGALLRRGQRRSHELVGRLTGMVDRLRRASAERDELERLKDEFVSNLTHELKTPLSSTCAYSELMLQGRFGDLTPKQNHALAVGLRNLRHLEQLIDGMLEMARLDAGQVRFSREPFVLHEVLDDVTAMLEASTEEKGLQLQRSYPREGSEVLGDRDGIRTVVQNLMANAVKFTEAGGTVTLEACPGTPGRMRVEVRDTGIGIPESAHELIFHRFRQVEGARTRRHGGAGLGLAIVKRILDVQEIPIRLESQPGKGSTFWFELPLAEPRL